MNAGSNTSAVSGVTDGAGRTAVTVLSGGVDSTVLAYHLAATGWQVRPVSFDYGQRHARELLAARRIADGLGLRHDVVDLRSVGRLLSGSALTDATVEVPSGHYTDVSMRSTVVANRNAIFTSVAVGVAVAEGAAAVALGIHAGDHPIYPDCRPEFVAASEQLALVANEGFMVDDFQLLTPWLYRSKADIVRRGAELAVPFGDTWSCYRGEERHCGWCGTCVERREAFELADLEDPTEYAAADDAEREPLRPAGGSEHGVKG